MILKAKNQTGFSLENHFLNFKHQIIGEDYYIKTPYHDAIRVLYTDWTASGRLYNPIEQNLKDNFYPLVANTHTKMSYTGFAMTYAYEKARHIIKEHVGADNNDILISCGSGMTGAINKFQRLLGLRLHESHKNKININESDKPVVFITHMEHHSNQTSWLETIADVVVVPPDENGLVSVKNFEALSIKYFDRKTKIASITACSNVTGIKVPYLEIAQVMHQHKGLCFVDFSASAPYVNIEMHENNKTGKYLDAVMFSPHKFLGGPGSTGILVFNKNLYKNNIPDNSGGGTVHWTNPWGEHKYVSNIEEKEDGGTPAFLQTIRVAMSMILKEKMQVDKIQQRENEISSLFFNSLDNITNVHILAEDQKNRLPIFSLYIDGLHYKLAVKMLNDRYGIQARGGCSCAGTYGHYLLNVSKNQSNKITCLIDDGDLSQKPGWIRISFHPTNTNEEILFVAKALKDIAKNHKLWSKDYQIDLCKSKFIHKTGNDENEVKEMINASFNTDFLLKKDFF